MNDEMRKVLALYIGECWHEFKEDLTLDKRKYIQWRCSKCNSPYNACKVVRKFTTPDDAHAVFKAMVDKKDWAEFEDFLDDKWNEQVAQPSWSPMSWSHDPVIFCTLAGEWLMKEGKFNGTS